MNRQGALSGRRLSEGYLKELFSGGRFKGVFPAEASRSLFWFLGGVVLFLAFLSLWQRNKMIHIGYEIERFHQQKIELLRVQKELWVEVESLNALERIERIAADQLKMTRALPEQRVYLKKPVP